MARLTLGLLLAGLIIVGALWPTVSAQMLNAQLIAAISVVLVVWCTRSVVVAVRHRLMFQPPAHALAMEAAAVTATPATVGESDSPFTAEAVERRDSSAGGPAAADDSPPAGAGDSEEGGADHV